VVESPYLRMLKNKLVPLDPSYLHELEVFRAMLRQEDYQRDSGWGGSWTKERYQDLKEKHPDALMVFETELRIKKESERHRNETFQRLMPSPYIERQKELPDSKDREKRLRKLRTLKWLMIASRLGNVGYIGGMALTNFRNGCPEAYEAFERELGR
jgi:hypothetical protein